MAKKSDPNSKVIAENRRARRDYAVEDTLEAGIMLRTDKQAALSHLRALGFTVSIDDFGVGFSNLAEVLRMAPDYLKIDKQFIQGIDRSETSLRASLVPNIIDIALQMKAKVIAEGIETHEQLEALRALGVRLGQGYLLSRPVSADILAQLIAPGTTFVPDEAAVS